MANSGYLAPGLPDLASPVYRINRAGHNQLPAQFRICRDASYPFCNLHLVLAGTMTVRWHDREWLVPAGELFLLPAYAAHEYRAAQEQPVELLWIEFYGGDATRQAQNLLERHGPVFADQAMTDAGAPDRLPSRPCAAVEHLLRRLLAGLVPAQATLQPPENAGCGAHRFADQPVIKTSRLIYDILLALWNAILPTDNPAATIRQTRDAAMSDAGETSRQAALAGQAQAVALAIDYIRQHPAANPTVRELAGLVRFNPTHFAKFFRQWTGSTPARWVLAEKINRARILLATDDRKINAIASELGFCSASHFIRQFRQLAGQSPSAYRLQNLSYRQADDSCPPPDRSV